MKARFAYPLAFLLPSLMVAVISAVIVGAAAGGVLWLFVYGDNTWPDTAETVVMSLVGLVAAATLGALLFASYSFGKARELTSGMSKRHLVLAAVVSVLLPLLVLLHQWQVGNLGAQPVPANNSFKPNPLRGSA
jgi:hypothetical protein